MACRSDEILMAYGVCVKTCGIGFFKPNETRTCIRCSSLTNKPDCS